MFSLEELFYRVDDFCQGFEPRWKQQLLTHQLQTRQRHRQMGLSEIIVSMAGITSIEVKESLEDLALQLQAAKTLKAKERLQVLYWLKQDNPPSILTISKAIDKHRNTLQTWLMQYRSGGIEAMLEVKKSPGGVRVIPQFCGG
ncbi:helix-turn-helix domain-containing protein [Cyanobacteria bacterium FACHB-63]|nr:helix-turn-helix domain-containing protein [Cyanobacteria bacterium FACHB-63]